MFDAKMQQSGNETRSFPQMKGLNSFPQSVKDTALPCFEIFNIHGEKNRVNAVGPVINHVVSAFWRSGEGKKKTEAKDQHGSQREVQI